jgi:hypothetical protein
MNLQVIKNRVLLWLRRFALYTVYFLLVFFSASYFLLQSQTVQEKLLNQLTKNFSKVTGYEVSFGSFYLTWFDRLEFHNLKVVDPEHNTMIHAGNLYVNFELLSLLNGGDLTIDAAILDSADVNLVEIQDSDTTRDINFNAWINKINEAFSSGDTTSTGNSPKVNITEVSVKNTNLLFNNSDADSINWGFDYNHFRLRLEHIDTKNFQVIGDTIQFKLTSFEGTEPLSNLSITDFKSYFRICKTSMEFLGVYLKAGRSTITDTITFHYNGWKELNDFNTKVSFNARLRNTVIDPQDLEVFAPGVKVVGQPIHLDGNLKGRVNRFTYTDMKVSVGNTTLKGKLDMDGLPVASETFTSLTIKEGKADINDLRFLFPDAVFARLKPFGKFAVTGNFIGFKYDFVANGKFDTYLGKIRSDINLKINETDFDESTYRGNLSLDKFQVGSYLRDTLDFQNVTLNGQIKGKGLTEKSADFFLNGKINSIGLFGYNYTNITTNARFASQLFNGKLTINDPNLKFNAIGSIDFRNNKNQVRIKANLDTALLHELKFTKEFFRISSFVDIDSRGLKIDSLFGEAIFRNTTLNYKEETLHLDSIHLTSSLDREIRKLKLRSSLADIDLEGNYYYSSLFSDLQKFANELYLNIKNNKQGLTSYYAEKRKDTQAYHVNITAKLNNINPLITLADLKFQLSKNTTIKGNFSNGITTIFRAYTTIDTLTFQHQTFSGNEIEFSASKIRDSTNVLAMLTINSDKQVNKSIKTKNLLCEAIWNKDHIDLGLDFDQDGLNNLVRLKTEIDFLADSIKVKILPSRIKFLEKEWKVNPKNYLLIKNKEVAISHLSISHENESILIDGNLSDQADKELRFTISELNLNILNVISTEKFMGTLNASLKTKDFYKNPYIQNVVSIKDFTVNDFLIGNIHGTNQWNQESNKFDLDFSIDRIEERIISLHGFYDPANEKSPLNVTANLQKANLKIAEPILRGIFSNIGGTLTGTYAINGTFADPKVEGEGTIEDGKMTIDYLKTTYSVIGKLGIAPTKIVFKELILTDVFNNKGTLNGYLAHKSYSYASMNLYLESLFSNVQLLNTTSRDNTLFYGTAYGTGSLTISGPINHLQFKGNGKSEKNTRIFIPFKGTEAIEKEEFVNFVHFTDSSYNKEQKKQAKEKIELSGITFDLNLEVTPDAYGEFIIDAKSGDIIRGRGNGQIKLQLDTKGEFNMFGGLEFQEGGYNFTLFDIINKEFKIQKGSRITWAGDPFQGVLSLTASYKQLASFAPIYGNTTTATSSGTSLTDNALKRRYPVEVILKLEGLMLSPQINFDIEAKDLPASVIIEGVALKIAFDSFKARLDELELKNQVFSLIVLRKFKAIGESFSVNNQSVFTSVSELFSNQLSYWISQVDQNLEVDLDLGTLDQEAFNTFQLRLSYSLLNGRLRITRDGTFNNTYQTNRSEVSSILGDFTVDYLLTPDGTFKIKAYSKSSTNSALSSLGNQSAITTGVSLLHTKNFNTLGELLGLARNRRKRELENEATTKDGIN